MNQYLLSKQINFTDLTVKNTSTSTINCLACGCEMPYIYVKARTNFEDKLKLIGFTKSNSPDQSIEIPVPDSKIKIDLSYQGFFFKENRTTNKINYGIISKSGQTICGDNRCDTREQYLYELDLSKYCSISTDRIVNFDHCASDCKETLSTVTSITQTDFDKLQFNCLNQPSSNSNNIVQTTPTTLKPIIQMTQIEKNQYITQLQTLLIQLLTQLLSLLKK
jgi:hypothetical protein